jgi:hypothetical protein
MTLIRPDARRALDGVGDRPAALDTPVDSAHVRAKSLAQFGNGRAHPAVLFDPIRPLVACLRGRSNPAAVSRLIATIDIDAVDRVPRRRTWPHVSQESFKALQPSVTHTNAATTVIGKAFVVGIAATSLHPHPGSVFGAAPHAVRSSARARRLPAKASAGLRATEHEAPFHDDKALAAVAADCPRTRRPPIHGRRSPHHNEPSEPNTEHRQNMVTTSIVCNRGDAR